MFSFLCVLLIILAIQECHDESMNNEAKYRKKELAELEQLRKEVAELKNREKRLTMRRRTIDDGKIVIKEELLKDEEYYSKWYIYKSFIKK